MQVVKRKINGRMIAVHNRTGNRKSEICYLGITLMSYENSCELL